MAKDQHSKVVGEGDYTDRQSVSVIDGIIAKHRRFTSHVLKNDKTPVTDGSIEVTNEHLEKIGMLTVQVKTLSNSEQKSYDIDVAVFSEVERVDSIVLLAVDNENEKVYWKLIDKNFVQNTKWKGQKTKRIYLDMDVYLSKTNKSYIDKWVGIIQERNQREAKLSQKVADSFNDQIGHVKKLLEENRYQDALDAVASIEERQWQDADDNLKFRILNNKGIAYQGLGDIPKAIELLREACRLKPEDPTAIINSIAVKILEGDFKGAVAASKKILKKTPDNTSIASLYAQAAFANGAKIDSVTVSLSDAVLTSPDLLHVLAKAYVDQGDVDTAISNLERAVKKTEKVSIHNDLGLLLIQYVGEKDKNKVKTVYEIQDQKIIRRAMNILNENWKKLTKDEDRKNQSYLRYNIALGHMMIGEKVEYEYCLDEVIRYDPDNEIYLQQYAISSIADKLRRAEALKRLQKRALKNNSDIVTDTLFITLMRADGKYERALKAIDEFKKLHADPTDKYWQDVVTQQAEILLDLRQPKKFDELISSLGEVISTSLLGTILRAKKLIVENNQDEAEEAVRTFYEKLYKAGHKQLDLDFADLAYELKLYQISASIYSDSVVPNSVNGYTRRLMVSLYYNQEYQKVIDIVKNLSLANTLDYDVAQFAWLSYMSQDRIDDAISCLELFTSKSNTEAARLELASLKFRNGDTQYFKKYANSSIDYNKLDLRELLSLASLLRSAGKIKRTLELMYEIRRKYPNESEAHSFYVNHFLMLGDTKTRRYVSSKIVKEDSVLFFNDGKFIIENLHEPRFDLDEIGFEEAKTRGFIGKKVGDEIIISSNPMAGETKAVITEVKSKYLHALHESMKNYESRFVGQTDLMRVPIDTDGSFKELKDMITKNHERASSAEELYKSKKLTIDLFAKMLGKKSIELTFMLMANSDVGLIASDGSDVELQKATSLLEDGDFKDIVLDLTSVLVMYEIGVSALELTGKKFLIAVSIRDAILEYVETVRINSNQKIITLQKKDEQYLHSEDKKSISDLKLTHANSLFAWVQDNTVTASVTDEEIRKFRENPQLSELSDGLDKSQLDTLRLLMNDQRLFICDDILLRGLAIQVLNSSATWTLAYLNDSFTKKTIGIEAYLDFVLALAKNHYRHTGISPLLLMNTAIKNKWQMEGELSLVVETLSLPEIEIVSMMSVFIQFVLLSVNQNLIENIVTILPDCINLISREYDRRLVVSIYTDTLNKVLAKNTPVLKALLEVVN